MLVFIATKHKNARVEGPKNISLNYFDGLLDEQYKGLLESVSGSVDKVFRQ